MDNRLDGCTGGWQREAMAHTNAQRSLPVLLTGTPVLPRGDGRVQIGCEPASALILALPPAAAPDAVVRLLEELRTPTTGPRVSARLRAAGLTPADFTALMDQLVAAGKAVDPVVAQATALRIRIHGRSDLARQLAVTLRSAGLPVLTDPIGPAMLTDSRRLDCNLLILADRMLVDPAVRPALMAARTPHLPVCVQDGIGVIGPLVLPGYSSCLRCADLHRTEADPEWPLLAARMAAAPGGADPETVAVTAVLARREIDDLTRRLAAPDGAPPQILDHRLQVHARPAGTRLVPAPLHRRCDCRTLRAPLPSAARVHYPRGRRKDSVERYHTGTRSPQCQAGVTATRNGGASSSRVRQTAGR